MEKTMRNILLLILYGPIGFMIATTLWWATLPNLTAPEPQDLSRAVPLSKVGVTDAREAFIIRVVDGDTVLAVVELGYDVMVKTRIRLARIDTPELKSSDSKKAEEAKAYLESALLKTGNKAKVLAIAKDGYGRFVCEVWIEDSGAFRNMSDELLNNGLAKVYKR